jgi:hypothetical protein
VVSRWPYVAGVHCVKLLSSGGKIVTAGNLRFCDRDVCHVEASYCNAVNIWCRRRLIFVVNKLSFLFTTKCTVSVVLMRMLGLSEFKRNFALTQLLNAVWNKGYYINVQTKYFSFTSISHLKNQTKILYEGTKMLGYVAQYCGTFLKIT